MGMSLLYSTGVAGVWGAGGGFNALALWAGDEEKSDLFKQTMPYNYNMRNSENWPFVSALWQGCWPSSAFISGDQSWEAGPMFGSDLSTGNGWNTAWELPSCSMGGMHRDYFVMGNVTGPAGTPLAACNVELFLTSTNAYVSQGTTDSNGNYMLATPFTGAQHFIYANYANGTYVGSSGNTLTPNF